MAPNRWDIYDLLRHAERGPHVQIGGVYHPARPLGFYSLPHRLRLAWAVFTGRADALFWPGQNPTARN